MKNILFSIILLLPLAGCSASIGTTPPVATSTTYTTPAVSSTHYAAPVSRTTVTRTY